MTTPSPFMVAREAANNLSSSFGRVKDENAIERILSDAMSTGNPEVLQNSIGKILSQVSPQRQGAALQYLQNAYSNVQQKKERERLEEQQRNAALKAGYTFGVPPQVAAQEVKEGAKSRRLAQYGLGTPESDQGNISTPLERQNVENEPPLSQSAFKRLSDDQLIVATGAPDREISEPAKAELQRRQEENKLKQSKDDAIFKENIKRSSKLLERADTIAEQIPQKRTAVNLMKDAIANRDLSFWTRDNLAELTGIEGFRSKEGAIFKTAGKEYFLGNIGRAGARPNQWIEQQIADMMTKIGRSTEANLSVARALENELDLDEARVKFTNEIAENLESKGEIDKGKLSRMLNERMSKYANERQDMLFNDLRAIKAISENQSQKYKKVEKGTQVSEYMAQALLKQFNNDPKKAAEEATKLGYDFE